MNGWFSAPYPAAPSGLAGAVREDSLALAQQPVPPHHGDINAHLLRWISPFKYVQSDVLSPVVV